MAHVPTLFLVRLCYLVCLRVPTPQLVREGEEWEAWKPVYLRRTPKIALAIVNPVQ